MHTGMHETASEPKDPGPVLIGKHYPVAIAYGARTSIYIRGEHNEQCVTTMGVYLFTHFSTPPSLF